MKRESAGVWELTDLSESSLAIKTKPGRPEHHSDPSEGRGLERLDSSSGWHRDGLCGMDRRGLVTGKRGCLGPQT